MAIIPITYQCLRCGRRENSTEETEEPILRKFIFDLCNNCKREEEKKMKMKMKKLGLILGGLILFTFSLWGLGHIPIPILNITPTWFITWAKGLSILLGLLFIFLILWVIAILVVPPYHKSKLK